MQTEAIIQAAKDHKYQVKGIRTFLGMEECGGFNATLYRDGKKVAFVINEDCGGSYIWRWESKAEEDKMTEVCKTIPPEITEYMGQDQKPIVIDCDPDIFISALVSEWEEERYWKRKCKTKTCVILKSHTNGQYIQYNRPYSPELARHIREKHGDDLKEIVNERLLKVVTV